MLALLQLRPRLSRSSRGRTSSSKHVHSTVQPDVSITPSKFAISSCSTFASNRASGTAPVLITTRNFVTAPTSSRHSLCRRSMGTWTWPEGGDDLDSIISMINLTNQYLARVLGSDYGSLAAKRDKLEEIVGLFEKAMDKLDSCPNKKSSIFYGITHSVFLRYLSWGRKFRDLHMRTGSLRALDLSIRAVESALDTGDASTRATFTSSIELAHSMLIRGQLSHNSSEINRVYEILDRTVRRAQYLHRPVDRAQVRSKAALLAIAVGKKNHDPAMLDSADGLLQQAAAEAGTSGLAQHWTAPHLQRLAIERYVWDGKPFTVNKIHQVRQSGSLRAIYLAANSTRDPTLLEELLYHFSQNESLGQWQPSGLVPYAQALYLQYNLTGKSEHRALAARLVRDIVRKQVFIHPLWDDVDLEEWYILLSLPYEVLGDHVYLDELITMLSKAVDMTPEESAIHIGPVLALTHALNLRGTPPDRELAAQLINRCLEKSGPNPAQRGLLSLNLKRASQDVSV